MGDADGQLRAPEGLSFVEAGPHRHVGRFWGGFTKSPLMSGSLRPDSPPEHAALDILLPRLRAGPGGGERPSAGGAGNAASALAVSRDIDIHAGPPGERHDVALLHVADE